MGVTIKNELGSDQLTIDAPRQRSNKGLLSPIKRLLKSLNGTKKGTGIGQKECSIPNNLPPLTFHAVHGENIRLLQDRSMAKRYEGFCKGITFSARPVMINERVYVRFSEMSENWSGVIRFGFTSNDPSLLRVLPKYSCPNLSNKPGYWVKALNERYCERDNILFYYVTTSGDVHFGINDQEKGVFITGVDTKKPLWTIIDIYGNCSTMEFLHPRSCLYPQTTTITPRFNSEYKSDPMRFHAVKSQHVSISVDKLVATRDDAILQNGCVFTARPICIGEKIIVQILRKDDFFLGKLMLGLTWCDPAALINQNSNELLNRSEYWAMIKHIGSNLQRGDEIAFTVTSIGEFQISKNNEPWTKIGHVDPKMRLWAYLDLYGSMSVRVFSHADIFASSCNSLPVPNNCSKVLHDQICASPSQHILPTTSQILRPFPNPISSSLAYLQNASSTSDMLKVHSGSTVLVLNLSSNSNNDINASPTKKSQVAYNTLA